LGRQRGVPVLIQPNRRRGLLAALQRYRCDSGQPLKFEPDEGVFAKRSVILDHGECDDTTRVVEFYRDHLTYPDTVEVDAAAVAQAGRRPFEHNTQGAARLG